MSYQDGYLAKETVEGIVMPAEAQELRQAINEKGEVHTRMVVEFLDTGDNAFARVAKFCRPGTVVKLVVGPVGEALV